MPQIFKTSGTLGEGSAVTLSIEARESVEVIGKSANGLSSLLTAQTRGSGNAGNLTIKTGQLTVRDGAEVSVNSISLGNAGELTVSARNVLLDNQGKLRASTDSGSGGNINLQVWDLILMRRDSLISAEAIGRGNGGNITSNAQFIVAVPSENSDIIANAVRGQGGNINIKAQGIYGLTYRDRLTTESDITASSEFGVDGVVEINTLDVDPSQDLAPLPAELVEASGLIATGCAALGENEFIVTGRGGLPPNPSDPLSSDTVWTDLRPLTKLAENRPSATGATQPTSPTAVPLVEAQGWVINNKGEVVLTAPASPLSSPTRPATFEQIPLGATKLRCSS